MHANVLPVVERVLDPGCLVSSLSSIAIDPGETAQPIHADDQLIPLPKPHVPTVCNTMWALTDFTEANGATRIIPGSHRARPLAPTTATPYDSIAGRDAEGQRARLARQPVARRRRERAPSERRVGIAMNYCAGWIRQQENQQLGHPARGRRRLLDAAARAVRVRRLQRAHRPHRQAQPGRDARRGARARDRWCGTSSERASPSRRSRCVAGTRFGVAGRSRAPRPDQRAASTPTARATSSTPRSACTRSRTTAFTVARPRRPTPAGACSFDPTSMPVNVDGVPHRPDRVEPQRRVQPRLARSSRSSPASTSRRSGAAPETDIGRVAARQDAPIVLARRRHRRARARTGPSSTPASPTPPTARWSCARR